VRRTLPGTLPPTGEIARLVEDYLAACTARGLSPKTLKDNYRFPLERVFLPFCADSGITSAADLDQRRLDRLSVQLLEKGPGGKPLSRFSVNTYLNAINLFLGWAVKEGEMKPVRAQTPRLPRRVVETLSREEVDRLEETAQSERDKLIVRVLADTGLRASELLGLEVGDLIQRDRQHLLKVTGKGDRQRLVPVPPADMRRLQRLVRGRDREDRVFLTLRRRASTGDFEPLSLAGMEQMIETLGDSESAELGKRVYPHLLRHSFATWTLTRGMNPIQLANILGHSTLRMIQTTYSHLTVSDSYEALMRVLSAES